jgi:hypothetical protein
MYKIIGGDQKEYGPVTADELRQWISEGRLNGQSRVWAEGTSEWKALSAFPEFADALRAQPGSAVPPPGVPMPPISADMWTAQVLAREARLNPIECIASSWKLVTSNFGLLFAASAVVWLIGTVSSFIPFVGMLYWAIKGVLLGGLYLVVLKRIRNVPAEVADVFSGFNLAFGHLVMAGLISAILATMGAVCCFVIPGIYLFVAWTFCIPLVADRRLEFWSAMELSRKVTTRVWFEVLFLLFLAFLPSLLMFGLMEVKMIGTMFAPMREIMESGKPDFHRMMPLMIEMAKNNFGIMLIWKIVVLFNLPFAAGALMYAYENLFGARAERTG